MKWLVSRWFPSRPSPATNKVKAIRRRLRLEVLEDRCVPATLHVTNITSDDAATAGTLRHEIVISAPNDTIVFDVAGTLTLTNGALAPSHALTIKGLGPTKDTINASAGTNNIFHDTSAALTFATTPQTRKLMYQQHLPRYQRGSHPLWTYPDGSSRDEQWRRGLLVWRPPDDRQLYHFGEYFHG